MATRIPAWRRLGLALQSEAQSGVAAPQPTTSHGGEKQPVAAPEAVKETQAPTESFIEPAQNGNASQLGKRKHQSEAADESEPTLTKKSRTVAGKSDVQQDASVEAPSISQEDHAIPDSTTEVPSTSTTAKGGDSNYRQGKKKKTKLTPRDRKKLAQQKAQEESGPSPALAEAVPVRTRATLLASTEIDHSPAPSFSTPTKHQPILRDRSKDSSGSPPRTDRRKSVAFTPDTKRLDGDSGQTWFKKWAAEQKGEEPETIAQPSFTSVPATNDEPKQAAQPEKKEKKPKKDKSLAKEKEAAAFAASAAAKEEQAEPVSQPVDASKDSKKQPAVAKGKKKDPSIYISYLTQYYNDHANWKFNKAKQNDVVDNALNVFRIPDEHSEALLEYIKGLKGAGVIERLQQRTLATIKELDAEDAKAPTDMDADTHKAAKEAALQERVTKEKKRRRVEGDAATFADHPDGDAYIRRMRRSRAEALLSMLGRTAPILPAPKPTTQSVAPQDRARKRKRRTDISSDESSSDSSSDDSSSDESDDDTASDSDSDSASASGSGSSSESEASKEGSSDSDSN